MTHLTHQLDALLARWLVRIILLSTALGAIFGRAFRWLIPARRANGTEQSRPHRMLITGSFYNDAWFDAHVTPLLETNNIDEVLVVTDHALAARHGVRFCNPSEKLQRRVGRIPARAVAIWRAARRYHPTCLMGYHIMPNALLCLLIGRWLGIPAIYQMTGGPVQLIDGGVGSENALLRRQMKPGRFRAILLHHLARQFDRIIVRGRNAGAYLTNCGISPGQIAIIPGAVPNQFFDITNGDTKYDLIAVGRLVDVKRYDRLLNIVAGIKAQRPTLQCAIVGDGPLRDTLNELATTLGISENVSFLGKRADVASLLSCSQAYILTSENEGLSIAMMEAMAAGLPAIVPDIGELSELLDDGKTGIFIDATTSTAAAAKIQNLLTDHRRCVSMGHAARERVRAFASTATVAAMWDLLIDEMLNSESTFPATKQRKPSITSTAVQS